MHLLAISESTRKGSYNLALPEVVLMLCPANSSVTIYDKIRGIPISSPAMGDSNMLESVDELMSKMRMSTD